MYSRLRLAGTVVIYNLPEFASDWSQYVTGMV